MASDDKGQAAVQSGELQEFRPHDIARIIETATDDGLDKIGKMAADSVEELKRLPFGEARHAQIAGALDTIQRVMAEKKRRGL